MDEFEREERIALAVMARRMANDATCRYESAKWLIVHMKLMRMYNLRQDDIHNFHWNVVMDKVHDIP